MVESSRVYQRKKVSIPIVFIPDELPPVASHTEILPMTPYGMIAQDAYGASMINTSTDGFCFISTKKLEPGIDISVKMVNFSPIPMGERDLDQCEARVKWCNTLSETEAGKCYEIGAQKIRKEDLPMMNFENPDFASMKCF